MFRFNDTVEKKKRRCWIIYLCCWVSLQPNTYLPRKYNENRIIIYDDRDRHFSPRD